MTTKKPLVHDPIDNKPIAYHWWLDDDFDDWAKDCDIEPQLLRRLTETAIRTRHLEATLPHPGHYAHDGWPNFWHLSIGDVEVIYSVEADVILIRGYGYKPYEIAYGCGFYTS